jgi:hypothetical protein
VRRFNLKDHKIWFPKECLKYKENNSDDIKIYGTIKFNQLDSKEDTSDQVYLDPYGIKLNLRLGQKTSHKIRLKCKP